MIALGLTLLTVASFFTDRSNAEAGADPQLLINVTGNQWWWDVQYSEGDPSKSFHTANELHLPVGMPVEVKLQSNDVIHSFWVPNLAGKQDLIPGRVTDIQLVPDKIGLFRGQCAEFCGVQHAHMALDVTVESRSDFDKWVAAQQRVAFAPQNPVELSRLPLTSRPAIAAPATPSAEVRPTARRARSHAFRQPPKHRRRHLADERSQCRRVDKPTRRSRSPETICQRSA